jgi:AcrR family transcriptional regulator
VITIKEFSEKEKEIIRQKLIENARKAFTRTGIKKTSIEELTNSVGIAKGSFYLFYKSKEALYFEILMNEISQSIPIDSVMGRNSELPFPQLFQDFLHNALDSMQTNPILKLMLIPEEYNVVYRRIAADSENTGAFDIIAPLAALIRKWQSLGVIIDGDAILLANVVKSLFLLTTHEEEIGETVFPKVMSFMIEMIVDKFTCTQGNAALKSSGVQEV